MSPVEFSGDGSAVGHGAHGLRCRERSEDIERTSAA